MPFRSTVVLGIEESEFSPAQLRRLRATTRKLAVVGEGRSGLDEVLSDADCLLLELGEAADRGLLRRAPRLGYIGVFGTGYESVDVRAAAERGVAVSNVPGYATDAVAEFTFAALLAHLRQVPQEGARAKGGDLAPASMRDSQLRGRTFGVIGLGRIGRRVAEIAKEGFGAEVRYWSRNRRADAESQGIAYLDVEALLHSSQVVSVNLALNGQTRGILDARRLSLLRADAVVVNLSPMDLFDLDALGAALQGTGFHLIFDDADSLPAPVPRRFEASGRCTTYPPNGYRTAEAQRARVEIFISNIEAFLSGSPRNLVGESSHPLVHASPSAPND